MNRAQQVLYLCGGKNTTQVEAHVCHMLLEETHRPRERTRL